MTAGTPARRARPVLIGITGPIGCGKSQVARWLGDLGVTVVDADDVARAVTAPGQPAHDAILARFGSAVTALDGTLDRGALARIVFEDPSSLRDLEQIVHPAVRPRIIAAIAAAADAGAPAVAVEAIKLVEGGLAELCDEVWLVTCEAGVQRDRLLARGMAGSDAERRIAAQRALTGRLAPAATRVIDSSGEAPTTRATVEALLGSALSSTA